MLRFCFCLFDRLDVALDGFNDYALDGLNVMPRWPQCYTLDGFYFYALDGLIVMPQMGSITVNVTPQMGSMLYP